ncbi:MAG: hypothetical protein SVU32_04425 [Candidatus Nanohaloarchaea archaeon]|nr:hypothetical protein [Candidatus Nanohaloarchaea archaeon]
MGGTTGDTDTANLTRRGFLWGLAGIAGGIVGGEAMLLSKDADSNLPLEVNIYRDSSLDEIAKSYGREPEHAQQIVRKHAEEAFDQLFEDMRMEPAYEIDVVDDPVDITYSGEDIETLNEHWNSRLEGRDDKAEGANLLITDGSYDALGRGESSAKLDLPIYEQHLCGTSNEITDASVLAEGERLLQIDAGDIREEVQVMEYREAGENERAVFYDPPHSVAFAGVHELGHNICLGHDAGNMETRKHGSETGLYVSLMMHSYRESFAGEEVHGDRLPDLEPPYDVFRVNRFSDAAVDRYQDELEGL